MKKNKQKGFVMAETIVVSVVVMTALVIIYSQFITINNSYYKSFKYNNINDLYKVNNIKTFILNDMEDEFLTNLNSQDYLDITSCQSNYFSEYTYCRTLFEELDVVKVIVTKENVTNTPTNELSEGMVNFINTINDTGSKYRIIAEFENSYATLKFDIGG